VRCASSSTGARRDLPARATTTANIIERAGIQSTEMQTGIQSTECVFGRLKAIMRFLAILGLLAIAGCAAPVQQQQQQQQLKTVDVYPVFESNEPDTLQRIGVPTRLFRPSDYNVPGLGLTFETRENLIASDPDLLTRFLKAAMHGVEFARDHPDQATDIVMK